MGRKWFVAASTGAYWGIGHGLGAALVGALAFALRGALNLNVVSAYMEVAVGVSISIIGMTGFCESREWAINAQTCPVADDAGEEGVDGGGASDGQIRASRGVVMYDGYTDAPPYVDAPPCDAPPQQDVARTLLNGVLNGVSGTGHMLGVLPALAMPNWAVAGAYLGCFGLGTFVAMALFTGLIGAVSSQMGTTFNDPAMPANLAMASSVVALGMGLVWTSRALVGLGLPAACLATARRLLPV